MAKNAPNHILIPKHKKISEKDKKALFEKHNITINELPSIRKNDPAIKDMGCEAGDVIMIERESATAGNTVFYRGVLDE